MKLVLMLNQYVYNLLSALSQLQQQTHFTASNILFFHFHPFLQTIYKGTIASEETVLTHFHAAG